MLAVSGFSASAAPVSSYQQSANVTVIKSGAEFLEKLKSELEAANPYIVLHLDKSVSGEKLLNDNEFNEIISMTILMIRNTTRRNNVVVSDYVTYEIEAVYRDDIKLLNAFKNPELVSKLSKGEKETLDKAKSIIAKIITPGMTDYEKLTAIHDYLAKNSKYDMRVYTGGMPESSKKCEGILLYGNGVCSAYSSAMMLLLGMENIECVFVSGTGTDNGVTEAHAWNKVKIDGDWYNVDTTWDAPMDEADGRVYHSYLYFCQTDDFFRKDHKWNEAAFPQKATATKYNYYVYNDIFVSDYNSFKTAVANAVSKRVSESEIDVLLYVENYDSQKYALDFIFGLSRDVSNISYSIIDGSEGEMELTIFFE
jgi:transglutaminase/protease-like cytokinesis protein 3